MKILLSWLRDFVDVPVEPERLAADLTLVGLAVDAVELRGDDAVLDLDITTNRVDCMNVRGIAREASVLYRAPLRPLEVEVRESGPPASEALSVAVEAPDLCPRFCARVLDVSMGPSPAWMRDRLEALGVRSISNVVDVTNYVMMEMGQPTHAFDLALVPEGRLAARWAREGETLETLDGVARRLGPRAGVVAGPTGPLAIAGVMGGAASEVSDRTRSIALEAAYWEPLAIRRSARWLSMHTEASHRFERGADPEAPPAAMARIAHLLQKIGAGTVRPGLIDVRPGGAEPRTTALRPERVSVVLGAGVPEEEWRRILSGLGFTPAGQRWTIPSWRSDVSREIDVIEEIGRHHGLDKIEATIPAARIAGGLKTWQRRERLLAETLAGAGLSEVVHYAFVSESEAAAASGPRVALENPLSEEQGVLRNSLVVPGLLAALRTNLRQGRKDVRLFEVGRVFLAGEAAPVEDLRLGFVLAGSAREAHWSEKPGAVDVFDAKGLVEHALRRLGSAAPEWTSDGVPAFLHPGRAAVAHRAGERLGYVGALHPDVAAAFDLREDAVVGELRIQGVLREEPRPVHARPLPRFPAVTRDVSVVWDARRSAAELEARVSEAAAPLLRRVTITDRYDRPPVPPGKVGLTLALVFQDDERTLTGPEVQEAMDRVARELRSLGAEIRGE